MRANAVAMIMLAAPVAPVAAAPAGGVYDGFDCAAPISDQRVTLKGDRIVYFDRAAA